jgi:hypothetical protein
MLLGDGEARDVALDKTLRLDAIAAGKEAIEAVVLVVDELDAERVVDRVRACA